jgi:hypothetical protein
MILFVARWGHQVLVTGLALVTLTLIWEIM